MDKPTFKAWNGKTWETFSSTKAAYKMLRERFNYYYENGLYSRCRNMEGEQIHICTEDDEYSYATVRIDQFTFNGIIFCKYPY